MNDKVIPLEEFGKRGTLTVYNQAYVEELESKIAYLTQHEQVEKEVKQEQKIKKLEEENKKLKNQNAELKGMYAHNVKENKELNKELGKIEGKLADLTSEYYELENLKNNEIAYLSEQIQKLKKDNRVCDNCKLALPSTDIICAYNNAIKALEENEQLKEKLHNAKYTPYLSCDFAEKNKKLEKRLTEAKEIIKKLRALYFSPVVTNDDIKRQDEILAETEEFLKEVEE